MSKAKTSAIKEKQTKSAIIASVAEDTGLTKKQVQAVLQSTKALATRHLIKNGSGEFRMPGMFKVTKKRIPAKPKRKGINPFTKEEQWFAAKPARNVVKVRPLKGLKDMV